MIVSIFHESCATTLFFITKCWGGQKILCLPCLKVGRHVSPVLRFLTVRFQLSESIISEQTFITFYQHQ